MELDSLKTLTEQASSFLQQPWVIQIAITSSVGLIVALFAKYLPRDKVTGWLKPIGLTIGKGVSKFLVLRIGKGAAEAFENGILVTLTDAIGQFFCFIRDGMLFDNEEKKK